MNTASPAGPASSSWGAKPLKEDVQCDRATDPEIEDPRDAIIKVASCAICGSGRP